MLSLYLLSRILVCTNEYNNAWLPSMATENLHCFPFVPEGTFFDSLPKVVDEPVQFQGWDTLGRHFQKNKKKNINAVRFKASKPVM